jgi:SAM-dependent methyltransferase
MSCTCCGLHYLSPRLKEDAMLSKYANDQYFSGQAHGYADYAAQEPTLRATFRRLLQTLALRGRVGGALLEIGCGYGYLLDEARTYFSRRVGTDFSSDALRMAKGHADEVYQGGVEEVLDAEIFDCIIATHVIEHVYHPHEFIKTLLKHLRPGGCLMIAAPDMGSIWQKLMGRRWPSFKLPEHVLYFDRHTLTRLLEECGIEQPVIIPYPQAFPLPLIASKLGFRVPGSLNRFSLWLPATTIAIMGVKGNA